MADRISLSKDWYNRGEQLLNEYERVQNSRLLFESYIYLWIALTVAAKEYAACNGYIADNRNGQIATDKEEILYWARKNCPKVMTLLQSNIEIVLDLCQRTGAQNGQLIMDVNSGIIEDFHNRFVSYWENDRRNERKEDIVETFILILNRVRNNLFHGSKSFRVESDIELLQFTTPLLKGLTKLLVNTL